MRLIDDDIILNEYLVKQQNLTQKDVNLIFDLHRERKELFEKFQFAPILPKLYIRSMVLELEELEFLLQTAWKVKQDKNMHTWWNKVPHCSCNTSQEFKPKRNINEKCLIHGKMS